MAIRVLNACRRWRRLSLADQLATLKMAGLVVCVTVVLKVAGFANACRLLRRLGRGRGRAAGAHDSCAQSVAAIVRVRHHAPWAGRCLSRSLALHYVLRRRGVSSEVHVGISGLRPFLAHAWVVSNGETLGERPRLPAKFRMTFAD